MTAELRKRFGQKEKHRLAICVFRALRTGVDMRTDGGMIIRLGFLHMVRAGVHVWYVVGSRMDMIILRTIRRLTCGHGMKVHVSCVDTWYVGSRLDTSYIGSRIDAWYVP